MRNHVRCRGRDSGAAIVRRTIEARTGVKCLAILGIILGSFLRYYGDDDSQFRIAFSFIRDLAKAPSYNVTLELQSRLRLA